MSYKFFSRRDKAHTDKMKLIFPYTVRTDFFTACALIVLSSESGHLATMDSGFTVGHLHVAEKKVT